MHLNLVVIIFGSLFDTHLIVLVLNQRNLVKFSNFVISFIVIEVDYIMASTGIKVEW